MITVIGLLYCGSVFAAFKVFKIKVAPPAIAVAVVIGVFILGGIVIGWKLSAPISDQLTLKRYVVTINTYVTGLVSEIYAEQDVPVQKGDPLFQIETKPFEYAVDRTRAQLAVAQDTVSQLKAGVQIAQAALDESNASLTQAKVDMDTALGIQRENASAISSVTVSDLKQGYERALASSNRFEASLSQSQFSLAAGVNNIDAIQAQLETALFDLDQCTYVAPSDGYVIGWQLREQQLTAKLRSSAVGTFMDTSETIILVVFPQNLLKNVKVGDVAELGFKRIPGIIVTGKVQGVAEYTGEGQFIASGDLPEASSVGSKGFLVARISLDDEELAKSLPLGAAGVATIYTQWGQPFHLISKITMRIKGLMFYMPF